MQGEYPYNDKKLYTEKAIAGSTLLGGPLGGVWLISKNFREIGLVQTANKWLYYGFIGTFAYLYLLMKLPDKFFGNIPNQAFQAIIAGVIYYLTATFQKNILQKHFESNGKKASAWSAAGVGFISMIITILVIFAFAFLQPTIEGNLVYVGNTKHEIFFSDEVTTEQAKNIGTELISMGYFTDDYTSYIKLEKLDGKLKVMFPFEKKYWKDKETLEALFQISSILHENIPSISFSMYLFEDDFSGERKEIKIN